jgi:RNA polymerase sigma factor (sigma-70 family)
MRERVVSDDDRSRFDSLVRPHLPSALHLALWLTRNKADAEDVVQDACVRAFRAIGSYNGGNPRTWELAIVRNTAFSMIQRSSSVAFLRIDELDGDARTQAEKGGIAGQEATPESELIAKADEARLESAISALPPEFREALVLRDMQRLSYAEIAEVTRAPVGTVMSRLARARQRLVASLKEASP